MNSQTQVGRPSPPPTTFLPASTSGCAYSTSGWFSHSCTPVCKSRYSSRTFSKLQSVAKLAGDFAILIHCAA